VFNCIIGPYGCQVYSVKRHNRLLKLLQVTLLLIVADNIQEFIKKQ
jgi:hypothetical protein